MSLKCQRDSYLTELTSRVVSCEVAKLGDLEGYEVVLEDTVLFPEGGGQPDDRGTLGDSEVFRVTRQGKKAVHFVTRPLEVGSDVHMKVDWKRRFDHMQQHSGQHLITAVADKLFGYKTLSWNLAIGNSNKCYIELGTAKMSSDEVCRVEDCCNLYIRQCIPMTPRWLPADSPELIEVRSRGLPDDFEGQEVRVVEIKGIDSNMCCGTHVSNIADLQCVKLLHTEHKRGSTLLYYVVGDRVLSYLQRTVQVEKSLTKLLSVGLDDHVDAADKIIKASKQSVKQLRSQLREIAQLMAFKHLHTVPFSPLACYHRSDGDIEFMNVLASELSGKCKLVLVTVGGDRGSGHFLLAGDEKMVTELGPRVAEVLAGKGGGRKGRYQGKTSKLEARDEAKQLLMTACDQ